MKQFFGLLLFIGAFTILSCGDDTPEVPICIDTLAENLKDEFCTGADLTLWEFNGRDVYCFYFGNCGDGNERAVIYEEDCTRLCTLPIPANNNFCGDVTWNESSATLKETIYTF